MKNLDMAISVAKNYAAAWSVPWGKVTKVRKRLSGFQVKDFHISFDSEAGMGEVNISCPDFIWRFEFIPRGSHDMLPLWAAFPHHTSITSGWRQGYGEVYKYRWHDWYNRLSDERRLEYKQRFPPPEDKELAWDDFYELIADVPADHNSIQGLLLGHVPKNDG